MFPPLWNAFLPSLSCALGYVNHLVPSWSVGVAGLLWVARDLFFDILCGQGAGAAVCVGGGLSEHGPSLALQFPDLAGIQRDPTKCYFLNTLAFHNNLTTFAFLFYKPSLKRETGLL